MLDAQRGTGRAADDEPLVVTIYGRARVLATYAGLDEIRAEALLGTTQIGGLRYLGTACTRVETEDLPGSDLLTTWDWHDTAFQLAQRLGSGGMPAPEPDMLALGPQSPLAEAVATDAAGPFGGDEVAVPPAVPSPEAPGTARPRQPPQEAGGDQLAALLARNVLLGTTLVIVVLIVGTFFYVRPRG